MMPFSIGTGLERVEVVGPDLDCWWAGLQAVRRLAWGRTAATADRQALMVALLCKNEKEGGSARTSPVTAPMPKSVPF